MAFPDALRRLKHQRFGRAAWYQVLFGHSRPTAAAGTLAATCWRHPLRPASSAAAVMVVPGARTWTLRRTPLARILLLDRRRPRRPGQLERGWPGRVGVTPPVAVPTWPGPAAGRRPAQAGACACPHDRLGAAKPWGLIPDWATLAVVLFCSCVTVRALAVRAPRTVRLPSTLRVTRRPGVVRPCEMGRRGPGRRKPAAVAAPALIQRARHSCVPGATPLKRASRICRRIRAGHKVKVDADDGPGVRCLHRAFDAAAWTSDYD